MSAQIDYAAIGAEVEAARALTHPQRLMRVTLECGHHRLLPKVATVMGVGASTGCRVCGNGSVAPGRIVVGVEETGAPGSHYTDAAWDAS